MWSELTEREREREREEGGGILEENR